MGLVVNAAANMRGGLGGFGGQGIGEGVIGVKTLAGNAVANMKAGFNTCPVVGELRDVDEQIAQANLLKVALGAGVLAFTIAPTGGPGSAGLKQAQLALASTVKVAALSTAH